MGFSLSNKVYDVLRFIVQIFLPAFGALYTALATLWVWGYIAQVVGTTSALAVFLGALLGLSRKNYSQDAGYAGVLVFDETNINNDPLSLHLDATSLDALKGKTEVKLRVRSS